ncbi:MAG TPA: 6-carboxytetrahydropterin synthase QueD [Candidatus Polarisedimenticolaceae bacterium]|nr:6-carboxytetrahydropterin synthase QueD [Candidatus Polarisedimenticolaceae bacterium]
MRVKRIFDFEAAHRLPEHPGKCRELHGHSYRLVVTVDRPVDPRTGLAIDFSDLKGIVRREAVDLLDHTYVNERIENPTAEAMAAWIWSRLREPLPGLVEVELWETRQCAVVYRGE